MGQAVITPALVEHHGVGAWFRRPARPAVGMGRPRPDGGNVGIAVVILDIEVFDALVPGFALHRRDQVVDRLGVGFGEGFEIDEIAVETEITGQFDQALGHILTAEFRAIEHALVRLEHGPQAQAAIAVDGVGQGRVGDEAGAVPADDHVEILPIALDMDEARRVRSVARPVGIILAVQAEIGRDQGAALDLGRQARMRLGGVERRDARPASDRRAEETGVRIGLGIVGL